ncbi:hypothetical protein MNBD_UNCLBAC01-1110 [hydrothermal vent metagenome]|uniref:Peptidase M48 domain-containing protein n=1 Tax=hydrothermal vent metagenome TaxID=652676 RepID=A0A3B1DVA1_9ZZZZ
MKTFLPSTTPGVVLGQFLIFLFFLTGCATEFNLATQKQERLIYGTDKEVKVGSAVAEKLEANYKVIEDVDVNERLQRILARIVAVCDRRDIVYFIKAIDEDINNALSLPGGYVYIFKGVLDLVENDDQLAGVVAHEVAHITARHGIKRLQNAYGALFLQLLSTQSNGNVAGGVNFALTALFMEYSQEAEFESDRLAVKYLRKAGYDPNEMTKFLAFLKKEKEKAPLRRYSYWRTHPGIAKRMAVVNQEITGKLEFRDYLNLIGND